MSSKPSKKQTKQKPAGGVDGNPPAKNPDLETPNPEQSDDNQGPENGKHNALASEAGITIEEQSMMTAEEKEMLNLLEDLKVNFRGFLTVCSHQEGFDHRWLESGAMDIEKGMLQIARAMRG